MKYFPIASAISAMLLLGCSGEQDPTKAGFADSLVNQSTGVYAERQAELEAEREAAQAENLAILEDTAALEAERARLERRINLARTAINSLESRIAAARASMSADDGRQARLNEVDEGLVVERANLATAESQGSEEMVLSILRQIDKLERDANTILEI